jgi:predicted dehydrogenase
MAGSTTRLAIVGLKRGRTWARELMSQPDMEIAAIVDRDEAVLHALGDEIGIPRPRRYVDYEAMLGRAEADLVILATPTPLHVAMSLAGLEAGCHVICEKPLAMTLDEARMLRQALTRYEKRFMVGEQYRFADGCRNLRRALAEGRIGRLAYIAHEFYRGARLISRGAEHWSTAYTEATLHDMAVHHFDMWWFLTGQPCQEVYARAFDVPWNTTPRKFGYSVIATLADGTHVDYIASRALARPETSWYGALWLVGEEGALFWDGDSAGVQLTRTRPTEIPLDQQLEAETLVWEDEGISGTARPVPRMLRSFLAAIERGEPHPCDIDDNLRSFVVSLAAIESVRTGQRVSASALLQSALEDEVGVEPARTT